MRRFDAITALLIMCSVTACIIGPKQDDPADLIGADGGAEDAESAQDTSLAHLPDAAASADTTPTPLPKYDGGADGASDAAADAIADTGAADAPADAADAADGDAVAADSDAAPEGG